MRPYIISVGIDPLLHDWATTNDFLLSTKPAGTCIYRGIYPLGLSVVQDQWLRTKCFDRLFEYCYLPSDAKGRIRAQLVQSLFSEIGTTYYNEAITLSINVECYNALFLGALPYISSSTTRVLDVGCGPGTILNSLAVQQATSLIGFDFVDANCVEARRRGLTIVNATGLAAMPSNSIDIMLCTFVLHYETLLEEDITQLIRILCCGGIWAANFHKSKGLGWFTDMLKSKGNFTFEQAPSHYGQLLFARSSE